MEASQNTSAAGNFIFQLITPDDGKMNTSRDIDTDIGNRRSIKTTEHCFRDYNIDHSKTTFSEKGGHHVGVKSRYAVDDDISICELSKDSQTLTNAHSGTMHNLASHTDLRDCAVFHLNNNSIEHKQKTQSNSKASSEEPYCMFSGFCVLPDSSEIIVCDNRSQTIKLINDQFIPTEKCKTLYEPWDVAAIGENLIIVSFPFVRMIQYFKFRWKNKIVPWYPFISGNEYYGITYDRGHVIATCMYDENKNAPSVHIIDKTGTIQRIIKNGQQVDSLFLEPKFIDIDRTCHVVYVLDQGNRSIMKIDRDGEHIKTITNICNDPSGIAVNSVDGTILVCNRDPPCILKLDNDLEPLQVSLANGDSVWKPLSLQYNEKLEKLFVTIEKSSSIRVFDW